MHRAGHANARQPTHVHPAPAFNCRPTEDELHNFGHPDFTIYNGGGGCALSSAFLPLAFGLLGGWWWEERQKACH